MKCLHLTCLLRLYYFEDCEKMKTMTKAPRRYVFLYILTCNITFRRLGKCFIFFTILQVLSLSKLWKVVGCHCESQNSLRSFKGTRIVRSLKAIKIQKVVVPKSLCTTKMLIFSLFFPFLNFRTARPREWRPFHAKK